MVNVGNPNFKCKNRLRAKAAKSRKEAQKASTAPRSRIAKADATRGARPGLLPTSGPNARKSSKKLRKLEKQMRHALQRKMEAEGEVVMKDVPEVEEGNRSDMDTDDQIS